MRVFFHDIFTREKYRKNSIVAGITRQTADKGLESLFLSFAMLLK